VSDGQPRRGVRCSPALRACEEMPSTGLTGVRCESKKVVASARIRDLFTASQHDNWVRLAVFMFRPGAGHVSDVVGALRRVSLCAGSAQMSNRFASPVLT